MKIYRFPTCIIVRRKNIIHLFWKVWWDKETKSFLKGDKTIRQKKKELKKKGLTDSDFYKSL